MSNEFCIAQAQSNRVTFVNHQWIGSSPMDPADSAASLASCPWVWDWLNAMGAEGWDLAHVVPTSTEPNVVTLYLRRARD
jgi:hypothetical protein